MAATKGNMTLRMEPELKAQAVSYTHLDVYKRQIHKHIAIGGFLLFIVWLQQ